MADLPADGKLDPWLTFPNVGQRTGLMTTFYSADWPLSLLHSRLSAYMTEADISCTICYAHLTQCLADARPLSGSWPADMAGCHFTWTAATLTGDS